MTNLHAIAAVLSLLAVSSAALHPIQHANLAKRQVTAAPPAVASNTAAAVAATGTGTVVAGITVPPLISLTSGLPSGTTLPVTTTFAAGATAPFSGAPALPTPFVFSPGNWPPQDKTPPTDSDEVKQWLTELDGHDIPNLGQTVDGTCASDPAFAANASARGWWSCGGYTRVTDISACPKKMDWGISFDDGPAPYTQTLLKYLDEKKILATFFVVGSRVIERPQVLVEEYMAGHEISVHTWSHPHLTTMTNEQIVAELGWTRKAIKTVLGVTPTTMRAPYGDLDDRVRAIALAMGLIPIQWTRTNAGVAFDTNDWKVPGGVVTAPQAFSTFENILGNASTLDTGFIVLEHDLFEITVDLAMGYFLDAALTFNPPFNILPIGKCSNIPTANLYLESNTNKTFPYPAGSNGTHSSGGSSGNHASTTAFSIFGASIAVAAASILLL